MFNNLSILKNNFPIKLDASIRANVRFFNNKKSYEEKEIYFKFLKFTSEHKMMKSSHKFSFYFEKYIFPASFMDNQKKNSNFNYQNSVGREGKDIT